ncbi:unnamed protein product, partial [Mesorhabditis belari]|uniref:7TM GPCR serpentine receptor class x (Srx) domain-containing protein n=1 Tax=Mesorhabditis belari TaxID=2138241 RepID=A0AAF3ERF4_9BILA
MNSSNQLTSNSTNLHNYFFIASIVEASLIAIIGFLGVTFGIIGLFIVRRNSFLKGITGLYASLDLINTIIINACHLLWGVPCALWSISDSLPFLNYFFGNLIFTSVALGFLPKVYLGLSRFVVLAFNGKYSERFERTRRFQYASMVIYPLCIAILYSLPGCHCVFLTKSKNYFWTEGEQGLRVLFYAQLMVSYVFMPITTFIDASIFWMVRKKVFRAARQRTSQQKTEQLRKEYRLAAQMLVNLVNGILLNVSVFISKDFYLDLIAGFIVNTMLWQICTMTVSLSYVVFFKEKRSKALAIPLFILCLQ